MPAGADAADRAWWVERLAAPGLASELAPLPARRDGSRPLAVLTAAREPRSVAAVSVWTFARDRYSRLRADRDERWDAAESALVRGLERHGFRDAFRALRPRRAGGGAVRQAASATLEFARSRLWRNW